VLVLFLHDIEKPFMQEWMAGDQNILPWPETMRIGRRERIIERYGIKLTKEELTAIAYVHGEGLDHSSTRRAMNELGALCHAADVLSASLWHSRNKPVD
jgi:hypothetical protein